MAHSKEFEITNSTLKWFFSAAIIFCFFLYFYFTSKGAKRTHWLSYLKDDVSPLQEASYLKRFEIFQS